MTSTTTALSPDLPRISVRDNWWWVVILIVILIAAIQTHLMCCQSAKWGTFQTEHFGIIRRH